MLLDLKIKANSNGLLRGQPNLEFALFLFFSGKEARGKDDAGQDSFGLMLKDTLRVKRIINNNIVIAEDFKGHEVVAIGKGLGFRQTKV